MQKLHPPRDKESFHGLRVNFKMVSLDRVDNTWRHSILSGEVSAYERVRAFDFVIEGFADVVQ